MKSSLRCGRLCAALCLLLLVAACGSTRDGSPTGSPTVGYYKIGKPYRIKGRWYYPEFDPSYDRVGVASWYGDDFHGLPTANGEVFDKNLITAAHPTLPLPSIVRVTNLDNGRWINLRVNDRGPFIGNRLIDLSEAAAQKLGYEQRGLARVRVQFLALADASGARPEPMVARRQAAPARAVAVAAPPTPPPPAMARNVPVTAARAVVARQPALGIPAGREVQVAVLDLPPTPACSVGPQFVQVGAFADTTAIHELEAELGGLERLHVEPAFVGERALARVRLGPVADPAAARSLLAQVHAMGYTTAFLTAGSAGGGRSGAC